DGEAATRHARLGDLEERGPDFPAFTDERLVHGDALGREILSEVTHIQGSAELAFPPADVFDRVCVDGLVGASVRLAIGLIVALEIHSPDGNSTDDGRLPDGASNLPAVELEGACRPDVDGQHASPGSRHSAHDILCRSISPRKRSSCARSSGVSSSPKSSASKTGRISISASSPRIASWQRLTHST